MRDVPPGITALAASYRRAVADAASRKLFRPTTVDRRSVSIPTSSCSRAIIPLTGPRARGAAAAARRRPGRRSARAPDAGVSWQPGSPRSAGPGERPPCCGGVVSADSPRFGAVLKRFRLAAGLTHEALAEQARLSARAISDLERGVTRAPRRETLALLTSALALTEAERALLETAARGDPAAAEPPARPHNLPAQLTSF